MAPRGEMEQWLLLNGIRSHAIDQSIDPCYKLPVLQSADSTKPGLTLVNNTPSGANITSDTALQVGIQGCLSHQELSYIRILFVFRCMMLVSRSC